MPRLLPQLLLLLLLALSSPSATADDASCSPQTRWIQNRCEPQGAYSKSTVSSAAGCCAVCAADAGCDHFVYNANQKQDNCHLKAGPIDKTKLTKGGCTIGSMPAPAGSMNLLYIVVDDLRNELGFTNHRKGLSTPNIDALAAKGTVFSRAYAQEGELIVEWHYLPSAPMCVQVCALLHGTPSSQGGVLTPRRYGTSSNRSATT